MAARLASKGQGAFRAGKRSVPDKSPRIDTTDPSGKRSGMREIKGRIKKRKYTKA